MSSTATGIMFHAGLVDYFRVGTLSGSNKMTPQKECGDSHGNNDINKTFPFVHPADIVQTN